MKELLGVGLIRVCYLLGTLKRLLRVLNGERQMRFSELVWKCQVPQRVRQCLWLLLRDPLQIQAWRDREPL